MDHTSQTRREPAGLGIPPPTLTTTTTSIHTVLLTTPLPVMRVLTPGLALADPRAVVAIVRLSPCLSLLACRHPSCHLSMLHPRLPGLPESRCCAAPTSSGGPTGHLVGRLPTRDSGGAEFLPRRGVCSDLDAIFKTRAFCLFACWRVPFCICFVLSISACSC